MIEYEKEYDFGFSIVDEAELRKRESELEAKVDAFKEQTEVVAKSSLQLEEKLQMLRSMIMVLLTNLMQEPEKAYIWWPNREDKVKGFIAKINEIVD